MFVDNGVDELCVGCHYSWFKLIIFIFFFKSASCDGDTTETHCLSCEPTNYRQFDGGSGKCVCFTGYYDNGNP